MIIPPRCNSYRQKTTGVEQVRDCRAREGDQDALELCCRLGPGCTRQHGPGRDEHFLFGSLKYLCQVSRGLADTSLCMCLPSLRFTHESLKD